MQNIKIQNKQEFSLLHVFQTGSGAHHASCLMGTGALSLGIKRPRREANHSPSTNPEVKKTLISTSTRLYLWICIREVLGSNLGRDRGYPERFYNVGIVTR
jgi:hypothetical protein